MNETATVTWRAASGSRRPLRGKKKAANGLEKQLVNKSDSSTMFFTFPPPHSSQQPSPLPCSTDAREEFVETAL